jgi:hypothetical protein
MTLQPIHRIDQKRCSALQIKPAAHDEANVRRLGGFMRAHDAKQIKDAHPEPPGSPSSEV